MVLKKAGNKIAGKHTVLYYSGVLVRTFFNGICCQSQEAL